MLHSSQQIVRHFGAMFQGSNLLFWRLFLSGRTGQARNLLATQLRQFLAVQNRQPILSQSIFEIFPEAAHVAALVEHKPGEIISCSIEELYYLAAITQCARPRRIFEFGTFRGRTTLNLALNAPDDAVVYTLDLPPHGLRAIGQERELLPSDVSTIDVNAHETGKHFREHRAGHKIVQLWGNSLEFDFSPYFGKMDLIFVDAAHAYRFVKSDTENALKMLAPAGVLLWHDYMSFGEMHDVTRYLFELAGKLSISQLGSTTLAVFRCARKRPAQSSDEVSDQTVEAIANETEGDWVLAAV